MSQDLPRVKIDGKRHYKVGEKAYPSVTTVTGMDPQKQQGIKDWKERVGPDKAEFIKNSSALLGTIVHHRLLNPYAARPLPMPELDMSWSYDGIDTDVETCIALWDQCDFPVEPNPYIEERVVNHEYEYAGTFDMMTDGCVTDLKTSSAVRRPHKMQAAAYFHAIERIDEYPDPDRAAIIKLDPDPSTNPRLEPKVVRLSESDIRRYFDMFCDLLDEL